MLPNQNVHADESLIIKVSAKPQNNTKIDKAKKMAYKDSTNDISARSLTKKMARQDKWVPVLPVVIRKKGLDIFHDSPLSGHLSVKSTLQIFKSQMYWDRVNSKVRKYFKICNRCKWSYALNAKPYGKMISPELPRQSHLDCNREGPLVKIGRCRRNEYISICLRAFSKAVHFLPLRKATALKIKSLLHSWIFIKNGFLAELNTDSGSQSVSFFFKNLWKSMNIEHETFSPYHQQSSLVGSYIKIPKCRFQANREESRSEWDMNLQVLEMANFNLLTGFTPAKIYLEGQLSFALDRGLSHLQRLDPVSRKEIMVTPEEICRAITVTREDIKQSREANKELYDKKKRDRNFVTGYSVLITNRKLLPKSMMNTQKLMKRSMGHFEPGEAELTYKILTRRT